MFVFSFFFSVLLQWQAIPSALPDDLADRCSTAVHGGHLYVASTSQTQGCFLLRTNDLNTWQRLSTPQHAAFCHGMVSHQHQLFLLLRLDEDQDLDLHPVLFRLSTSDAVQDRAAAAQPTSAFVWQRLLNGRTPTQTHAPALFGWGHSLVLVGGRCQGESLSKVSEYSLSAGCWLEATDWPCLPQARQLQHPVILGSTIHLLGGACYEKSLLVGKKPVFSLNVNSGRRRQPWQTGVIKQSPYTFHGACRLFGTVVIAGGISSRQKQVGTFVWDTVSQQWLRLPDLTVPRTQASLVYYKGDLLAFGGSEKIGQFNSSVESFSIAAVLGV